MPALVENKSSCCGCFSCLCACPVGAITKKRDEEGFDYPVADNEACVSCGVCDAVCPYKTEFQGALPTKTFAAKNKDEKIYSNSQSGGMFTPLAERILSVGGVVYGATFGQDFITRHIKAETAEEVCFLRGSKYVQSDTSNAFSEIVRDMKHGKTVLFCGTPCQVDGLKKLIEKIGLPNERLFTADLVCYGVPSPGIFEKWKIALEKKYHSRLVSTDLRERGQTRKNAKEKYTFLNGKTLRGRFFTTLYFSHFIMRPSCHNCLFNTEKRVGDITLGDFWGVEKFVPEIADERGVSLVFCNTEKGQALFDSVKEKLFFAESTVEDAVVEQPRLRGIQTSPNERRSEFFEETRAHGILFAMAEFGAFPESKAFKIKKKVFAGFNRVFGKKT